MQIVEKQFAIYDELLGFLTQQKLVAVIKVNEKSNTKKKGIVNNDE